MVWNVDVILTGMLDYGCSVLDNGIDLNHDFVILGSSGRRLSLLKKIIIYQIRYIPILQLMVWSKTECIGSIITYMITQWTFVEF